MYIILFLFFLCVSSLPYLRVLDFVSRACWLLKLKKSFLERLTLYANVCLSCVFAHEYFPWWRGRQARSGGDGFQQMRFFESIPVPSLRVHASSLGQGDR